MIAGRARVVGRAAERGTIARGAPARALGAAIVAACAILCGCEGARSTGEEPGSARAPARPGSTPAGSTAPGSIAPSATGSQAERSRTTAGEPSTVRVLAAASFTDVLGSVARAYERQHPSTTVELAFGGSQELRMHLEHGAEADAFVSANASHVEALEREGRATDRRVLPCNHLVVVTPRGNPLRIESLSDLARAHRIVLGVETSPIGRYTGEALSKLADREGPAAREAILAHVVSRELDVRQVLAKVRLREADAAIVYATDALSAGDSVATIAIDPALDVVARAFVARVTPTPHPAETASFLDHLSSPESVRAFHDAGFVDCP